MWNRKDIPVDCDFRVGNRSDSGKDIFCIILNTCENGADSYPCSGTIETSKESASSEALFALKSPKGMPVAGTVGGRRKNEVYT